jgi:L-asparagine transporter-like permease
MIKPDKPYDGAAAKRGRLQWWQLSLLGLGFTTGTGFFLGSGLAIEKSGHSVLILFLLAAIGTYFVYDSLSRMISQKPDMGSFRTYTKIAFGRWAGFSHGWMYWLSEILILGSQLTALGLFTQFWFNKVPVWIFSGGYAVLGLLIMLLGQKGFEKAENLFAVVKAAALVMFIVLALLVIPGVLGEKNAHMHPPKDVEGFFEHGALGMWTGLIFAFFAFAGIEVMGLMATELKNPKDAPKSGKVMIAVTAALYIASIAFALMLAPIKVFHPDESPFVTALKDLSYHILIHIFNGVLIIAGFSALVASLFSVTKMMYTIAKEGDAPNILAKRSKRDLPYVSLLLTILGMTLSVVLALILPKQVYEYIATAGGLMLLFSWLFMLFSARKLLEMKLWAHVKTMTATVLIAAAISGTLFDDSGRPGFIASIIFVAVIIAVALILHFTIWRKNQGEGGGDAIESSEDVQNVWLRLWKRKRPLQK